MGIIFEGNNNTIEYNEIYDMLKFSDDMGAIYAGRSWVSGGTVIKYNYIHDCGTNNTITHGIYLDDGFTGTTVYGNVFSNLCNGVEIHYGRENNICNNIFLNCKTAVTISNPMNNNSPEKLKEYERHIEDKLRSGTLESSEEINLGYLYTGYKAKYASYNSIWNTQFPYLKDMINSKVFYPFNNVIERNAVFGKETFIYPDSIKSNIVIKNNFQHEQYLNDFSKISDNILEFEIPDITKCGSNNESIQVKNDFEALLPANGESNVQASHCILAWEDMDGTSKYKRTIATDKNFNNLVFNDIVNNNYTILPNIEYGVHTYYWKVEAYPDVNTSGKDRLRVNSNGVMHFSTAQYETVFTDDLKKSINAAQETYDRAVEGNNTGDYIVGSKNAFLPYINAALNVLNSKQKSQKTIDDTVKTLDEKLSIFMSSVKTEITTINSMLKNKDEWSGNQDAFTVKQDSLDIYKNVNMGYLGNKVENNQIFNFKAKIDTGTSWVSFGLRCANPVVYPWTTKCYIFLVKKDTLELQKFNGDKKFYFTAENQYIKPDVINDIKFGAITVPQGVQISVTIDGKEVFNYLDKDNPITEKGYFSICNIGSSKLTLYNIE